MKDKSIAVILAFFLGGLGIHQFYLGNNSRGILYLLFCWTLIPSIIGFIDGIILLTMSYEEFDLRYNNASAIQATTSRPPAPHVAEEIDKLYNLKQRGALTEEEFQQQKRRILVS